METVEQILERMMSRIQDKQIQRIHQDELKIGEHIKSLRNVVYAIIVLLTIIGISYIFIKLIKK